MTERRSFATKPPIVFDIDGDEFEVLGAIPAEEFAQLLDLQSGLTGEGITLAEQYSGIKSIFQFTMLPESWDRFVARLGDRSRPIDFGLLMEISNMLSSEWGKGRTPSASSSTEQLVTTETGTAGSLPEATAPTENQPVEISVLPDTSTSSTTGEPEV